MQNISLGTLFDISINKQGCIYINIFADISKNKNAHLNFSIKRKYPYKFENNNNILNFYLKTKNLIKERFF